MTISIAGICQTIFYGITIGSLYGLAASGLSLIFGLTRMLNLAHGAMLFVGAYTSYWILIFLHIDPFLTIPLMMSIMFLIGLLMYLGIFSWLEKLPVKARIV
jgi:branched-chain amino acid transport system permease protein